MNRTATLLDNAMSDLGGPRTLAFLEEIDAMMPWKVMEKTINEAGIYSPDLGQGGRPPWPLILKLRCLFLQKWFNLSDPMLEEMLNDRISFRRFVGISQMDRVIDCTTLWDFRNRLNEKGLTVKLFEAVNAHFENKGMIMQSGTIVDAKIVKCSTGKKTKDGGTTKDATASHTKKHGNIYHGHKAHVAVDKNGMVKGCGYTTAKDHDSTMADELLKDETEEAYGDSAYGSKERNADLEKRGVKPLFIARRHRGQSELTQEQKNHNRAISKVRVKVEHALARLNQTGSLIRARYRGLVRNGAHLHLLCLFHNVVQAASLQRRGAFAG